MPLAFAGHSWNIFWYLFVPTNCITLCKGMLEVLNQYNNWTAAGFTHMQFGCWKVLTLSPLSLFPPPYNSFFSPFIPSSCSVWSLVSGFVTDLVNQQDVCLYYCDINKKLKGYLQVVICLKISEEGESTTFRDSPFHGWAALTIERKSSVGRIPR